MRGKTGWLLALLPALLGLLVLTLTAGGQLGNVTFYLRGGSGIVIPLLGGLASAIIILVLWNRDQHAARMAALKQQLEAGAAEERRRFLRRLDHELKNPLTAIRAGLVNLASSPSEEARREALSSAEAQAVRLSRLAADLRKLAELETRPLECAPVDMGALLAEVVEVAGERPGANQRHLTLSIPQAPWPLTTIEGDQDLLFLAVHNLVDNALKFTQPDDTIEVRAFEDGTQIVVEVADTGPGVPENERGLIWDELYRGQGARGIAGSGLGLALVRAIAERHGGRVSLRSRPGQGTVFTLRLPI